MAVLKQFFWSYFKENTENGNLKIMNIHERVPMTVFIKFSIILSVNYGTYIVQELL